MDVNFNTYDVLQYSERRNKSEHLCKFVFE